MSDNQTNQYTADDSAEDNSAMPFIETDTTADSPNVSVMLIEQLQEQLHQAQDIINEQKDAHLRAVAEMENMRRRNQEEIQKAIKFAAEKFANGMLPVWDSLEKALEVENCSLESLREGIELTMKQLSSAFENANLQSENPMQQKFDPNLHQAISAIESDNEPNTVLNVLQKGFRLHDRILRPALVIVSRAKN